MLKLMGSQVIHIIHNPELFIPSRNLSSRPKVFHVNHYLELFIMSKVHSIYFYDGMSSSMKQLLKTMCGGDFMSKNPEEAMDFLSYEAEVSRG
ncbi:hypothetical protein CK203_108302 [Vitis vinifera]|uniref:Uncharacterized protein n=1 Tax=Vitis vinifera TaxID=29760 RepID=A0A438CC09_VITVI|nr:hypothetical protein CK203_108302 [Vitis vinifera]